ncbi:hypothetical protein [Ruminococcus albus]|uniref:Uncharacterized protein n=1 Tax=Ruminococcus albus TaxID=1264 RepID=A0A1H7PRL2_RUMAL|nr:hypothetical protein [Ruminococcus albus]SEL38226.1 hypothetical protein SAMN05216469_1249 [Ruminococcus albus]
MLFIILWVLSPIVLIPMCISSSSKRKKMDRFIGRLYRENRINSVERFSLRTDDEANGNSRYSYGQRNDGAFFRDEARNTYGQKGIQNDVRNVGYVPKPKQDPAAAQNAPVMQENASAVQNVSAVQENTAAQAAVTAAEQAERQPQHHHSGVDLVKHDDAEKNIGTGTVGETASQPAEENPVRERPAEEKPAQEMPAAAVHTMPEQRAVPMSSAEYNNRQPLPDWARPQVVQRPLHTPRPKREKKQYSSAAVLTGIGITFVALAGIIFSRAFWVQMSDWTRVGVLAGQAVLFFAMFGFAHKKLKIEGTAAAVYILGSVFATISYITMGYFGLLGAWFGFEGGGMMLFLAMGALLVTFFSAGAMKVFSKPFCEYAASVSMAVSGTLVLAQFANYFEYNRYAAFSMMTSAAGLLASIVFYGKRSAGGNTSKPVEITYKLVKAVYAVIAAPCLIADLNGRAEGSGWSFFGWGLWLIYTGETLWHAIRKKSEKMLAFHAIFILLGAFSLCLTLDDYHLFALLITVFSATGSWAYICLDKKKALIFRADKVHAVMRVIFAMICLPVLFSHPVDSWVHLATIIIWLVDFAAMASYYRSQYLLIPQCAAVLSLAYELMYKLDHSSVINGDEIASLVILAAGILGTALYRYLERKGKIFVKANAINVIMRVLMGLPAMICLLDDLRRWDGYCWAMCLLLIAELSGYAVLYRRQREIFFRFAFVSAAIFVLIPNNFYAYGMEKAHLYALIMFGISVVCTAVYKALVHYDKALFRAKEFIYSSKAVIGFGCVTLVYGDLISYERFSWVSWVLMSGMAAETLVYAIIKKSPGLLFIHNIFIAFMLFECRALMDDNLVFTLFVTALLAVLTMVYFTLEKKDKLRFTALSSIILMRSIFGLFALSYMIKCFGSWNWECFGLGIIIAMELLYYGIIYRNQKILAFEMIALTYAFWQIGLYANSFSVFALICCLVVASGSLADHFLKKKRFEAGLLIACTRVVYMMFYILMLIVEYPDFSWMSIAVWTILPAEMIFYGIRSKNSLFIHLQSLELPVLFYVLSCIIGDKLGGGYNNTFIFTMFIAAALAVYYIIPAVFTPMADILYTAVLFGLAIQLLHGAALPYGIFAMAVAAVFIAVQAFTENHKQSRFMQVFLPVPEIVTAVMLSGYLERVYGMHCKTLSLGICAAALCAGAFAFGFGNAEEKKYRIMRYALEIGAGVSLLMSYSIRRDLTAALIVTIVSVLLYAVIHSSRSNYHAILPLLAIFMGAKLTARAIWYDPMCEGNAVVLFSIFMTAVFAIVSRTVFAESITKHENGRSQVDMSHFGILLCVLSCFTESMMFSPRARLFIALLELAAFSANCIRRSTDNNINRTAMTCAAGFVGAALIVRPFMRFETASVFTAKVMLLIIVAFGMAVKKIWKDDKKLSSEFSQAVYMAAFLLLIMDGLMNQSLTNSLIVLCTSLVLLIFSFVKKTRRWFLVSAAALLGLTLYITGDFLSAVAWWAYLLLAGVLLITVAAVTEYMRQRAAKNPNEERFFVDWKW